MAVLPHSRSTEAFLPGILLSMVIRRIHSRALIEKPMKRCQVLRWNVRMEMLFLLELILAVLGLDLSPFPWTFFDWHFYHAEFTISEALDSLNQHLPYPCPEKLCNMQSQFIGAFPHSPASRCNGRILEPISQPHFSFNIFADYFSKLFLCKK